jgi:hypothetical protein
MTRERIKETRTSTLITHFGTAQVNNNRVAAYLLADELSDRGIAPFFWRAEITIPTSLTLHINQEYDYLVFDLLWIAKQYPGHPYSQRVPMERLSSDREYLFKAADSLFQLGNRPLWIITKKLKLTERQQWECQLLKSLPVKQKSRGLMLSAQKVYEKLAETMPQIMKTGTGEDTAFKILQKRKRLWICAEMCDWSPTISAELYRRMTGEILTKSQAANQLSKIGNFRRKKRAKHDMETD